MMPLRLGVVPERPLQVLCLGAHCDDIELGCGGTILRLLDEHPSAAVHWVVFSSSPTRRREAERGAAAFLQTCEEREVVIENFRESYFPWVGAEIKDFFEMLKQRVEPDLLFTHYRDDRHQDHRTISDLTWNTFRDHLILEYEIPKYDGDLGVPNLYVALSGQRARQKARWLLESFPSQRSHSWFDEDTFLGLMRLRGVEANAPERFAEAFYCRKLAF